MSELAKTPDHIPNDVALAAGKQVIAAGVELVASTIADTQDPEVREGLENELRDKLSESGVLAGVGPNGLRKPRTRDQVIMESSIIFWAKQRGRLPRPKKSISEDS